jgi:DNA-binding transcriptional ArsR family regulator
MNQFSALADPTRRRIVEMLSEHDESSGELSSRFNISQPAVSRHLRVLRDFGIVQVRTEGQRRIYSLQVGPLIELDTWLAHYRRLWTLRLDALDDEVHRDIRKSPPPQSETPTSSTNNKETLK